MYDTAMTLLFIVACTAGTLALLAFFSDGYAARMTAWGAERVLVWGVVVTARVYIHHKRLGRKPAPVVMTWLALVGHLADLATRVHERCIAYMVTCGWTYSTPAR